MHFSIFSLKMDVKTCLVKAELGYYSAAPDITLDCFDERAEDIECYPLKNLVFYTQRATTQRWRLIRYEGATNRSKSIVDFDQAISSDCNRYLDHGVITIDWRPYWTLSKNQSASVLFISEGSLWSYDINRETCSKFLPLSHFGLDSNYNHFLGFSFDWFNFYWLNSTTHIVHAFSLETAITQVLDDLNTTYPGADLIGGLPRYVVDIKPFSHAMTPLPFNCILPNIIINVEMTNYSAALVSVENSWNLTDGCDDAIRPLVQLNVHLLYHRTENSSWVPMTYFKDRLHTHSVVLRNLVEGKSCFLHSCINMRDVPILAETASIIAYIS